MCRTQESSEVFKHAVLIDSSFFSKIKANSFIDIEWWNYLQ